MSYETSDVELWQWGQDQTFGATSVVHYIEGPKGKVGFVRDIFADITTSLVGTTTVPEIQIGISSGDTTYGRFRLGTAVSTGYGVGPQRASQAFIQGNPPRLAADFTSHAVLDAGPYTTAGIAGGSYGTQVPAGRIPASYWTISNVIQSPTNGSTYSRIFVNPNLNGANPLKDLVTGNLVNIAGVTGSTSVNGLLQAITSLDTTSYTWFEVNQTFSTAYTGGGYVNLVIVVTCKAGSGGSPAGGGHVKVKIQWVGPETV
jgi:hypothetical protein